MRFFRRVGRSLRKHFHGMLCAIGKGNKILVLSDSHGGVFEYIHDHWMLAPHFINCEIVRGASAYGLSNDKSQTQSFIKFMHGVERFRDYPIIIILLGEVDCSFLLWNRAERFQGSAVDQIPHSMKGYRRLIEALKQRGDKRLFIAGAPLPTVKDEQRELQDLELRRQTKATQKERTELILAFNEVLKGLAREYGIGYFDITEESYDLKTGVVKESFVIQDRVDHHQSQEVSARFWRDKILSCCLEAEK